jgi:hypothetical protein
MARTDSMGMTVCPDCNGRGGLHFEKCPADVRAVAQQQLIGEPVAWQFRQRSGIGEGPQSRAPWGEWCSIMRFDYENYLREPNKLIEVRALYASIPSPGEHVAKAVALLVANIAPEALASATTPAGALSLIRNQLSMTSDQTLLGGSTLALAGENLMKLDRRVLDQDAEVIRLRAQVERMKASLEESLTDNVWNAYNCGITRADGKWMDGGMSDAEWLRRELDLADGWHDATMIRDRIPEVIAKQIANICALPSTDGTQQ